MSLLKKLLIPLVIVAVAIGGFLFWYLGDDAPAEVSLDKAVESVETGSGEGEGGGSAGEGTGGSGGSEAGGSVAGAWTVDTTQGEFDFDSATGTFAGFRIKEELAQGIGNTEAVGRTGDVTGSLTIDGTQVTEATFEVDLTTLTTDRSLRDSRVQSALDTGTHPTATFTLTEPIELGDAAETGEEVSVTATGELQIHGVTNPVEVAIDAQVTAGTLVVVGTTEIAFSDFDVSVPSSPMVLSVADVGTVEVQLLFTRS